MGAKRLIIVLRLKGIDIEDIAVRGITRPLSKAEYLMGSYHQKFKGIRPWQNEITEIVRRTRTLHDCFGRRRFFMGRMDDSLYRIACSYRPQASIVGVTNQAMRRLHAMGEPINLQVHDSLGEEPLIEDIPVAVEKVKQAFRHPITLKGRTFEIPIDVQVGPSWGDLGDYVEWPAEWGNDNVVEAVSGVYS
jgi:DNA polymerase I-like protein with 3'-5' exonuclease and polymerase domains